MIDLKTCEVEQGKRAIVTDNSNKLMASVLSDQALAIRYLKACDAQLAAKAVATICDSQFAFDHNKKLLYIFLLPLNLSQKMQIFDRMIQQHQWHEFIPTLLNKAVTKQDIAFINAMLIAIPLEEIKRCDSETQSGIIQSVSFDWVQRIHEVVSNAQGVMFDHMVLGLLNKFLCVPVIKDHVLTVMPQIQAEFNHTFYPLETVHAISQQAGITLMSEYLAHHRVLGRNIATANGVVSHSLAEEPQQTTPTHPLN